MPIGEIETHPYINYLGINPNYSQYNSIIIGSFPIYCITNSVPMHPDGIAKRDHWNIDAFMQFFYGSKSNYLWELLFQIYNTPFPVGTPELIKHQCIDFIENNKIIVSDVIQNTLRNEYKADDKFLIPNTYNTQLIEVIMKIKGNSIFFTALPNGVSPWIWFKNNVLDIIVPNNYQLIPINGTRNMQLSITYANQNKIFNVGFLFSPSPNGARGGKRSIEYNNYALANPSGNYNDFRSELYKQLILFKHFGYCGNNPVLEIQHN